MRFAPRTRARVKQDCVLSQAASEVNRVQALNLAGECGFGSRPNEKPENEYDCGVPVEQRPSDGSTEPAVMQVLRDMSF